MGITASMVRESAPGAGQPKAWNGWNQYVPWCGRATRADMALLVAILAVVMVGLAMRPLKPFLLASHPVLLEILTGDLTSVGAAAAFARVGETPLWLVLIAGAVGMMKFDWLTWWAGRQWGEGIIRMFTTGERAQRFGRRAVDMNPWLLRTAVVLAMLPGVPTAVVYAMAGIAGMRLATFLALDLAGTSAMAGIVASLGYALGQDAVDLVLLVDEYASLVSVALLATIVVLPLVRRWLRRLRSSGRFSQAPGQDARSGGRV